MKSRTTAPDEVHLDVGPDDMPDEREMDEVLLSTDIPAGEKIPLFQGVKVVYVGADPHHAPTLRGRVNSEHVGGERVEERGPAGELFVRVEGGETVETATSRNFTNYDFRARDASGVKSSRRMPVNHPQVEVRDRPFQPVKHGEHLYWFSQRRQDYHIVVGPDVRFALREYIAARVRSSKLRQKFIAETTAASA